MSSSKKRTSGRSPLVNQQSQITSFFGKTANSSSPSPSPSVLKQAKLIPKSEVRNPNPSSPTPCSSPVTPSPVQSSSKKPLLVIGQGSSPSTPEIGVRTYGKEVVDKRIRVYWPLDKAWYEGSVKSYDEGSGKHLIQYDDSEEEMLDLGKEKVEWIGEAVKKLKRLRKGSLAVINQALVGGEVEDLESFKEENDSHGDDSSDEDWGKNVVEEVSDAEEDQMELEEEAEDDVGDGKRSGKQGAKSEKKSESRKRKGSPEVNVDSGKKSKNNGELDSGKKSKNNGELDSGKKSKNNGELDSGKKSKNNGELDSGKKSKNNGELGTEASKLPAVEPVKNGHAGETDAVDRFQMRESEKLWFLGVKRRDAKKRLPTDIDYDPKTLYLPPDFVRSLSGGQKQWWEFKSKHMDKVLFFKMGKFYELFEMDAHIGAKELDLQYMKGEQPHCGFPEKNFSVNVEKLARKCYRVLVVEQTETPEQLERRRKEEGSKDKVVKREICAVVSRGTLTEGELLSANPDASYLMALTEICLSNQNFERVFGVCVVDATTSRIILGQFADDADCSSLCCLLSELRPVEIIKPAKSLSSETERVISRHTRNVLVNELVPLSEFWNAEKTIREVKASLKLNSDQSTSELVNEAALLTNVQEDTSCLPAVLQQLMNKGEDGSLALSAFGATLYYLKQSFLDEALLRFANFEPLPCSEFRDVAQKPYMILDASALDNLEIFENSITGDSFGTLYAQINHCVTAFGKRLLKGWLARPLYHAKSIKERQDAVSDLQGNNLTMAHKFRKALSRLPDMERLLTRMFACSEANGRNASKVVLYEDLSKKKLQEFTSALRGCELMDEACFSLSVILQTAESQKLRYLLTPGEGLPDINPVLKYFKDGFDWAEANNTGRIIPHKGVDMEYDSACKDVQDIEYGLKQELKEQKKILGDASITYVTVGKDVYLLEVSEDLSESIPQSYELRSSKKGFKRYWSPNIKKLVGKLSQAESEKELALKSILQRFIDRFCQHHAKWRQLVSVIAELDVLISLAIARDFYEGPTCRPVILSSSSSASQTPCLSAKGLGHPILRSDSLGKGAFVSNNISIGGSNNGKFILLTGPNMGGKSTLLRQICLATVLAQIGADVPAESFELSPVDRIFVRMGAKDHIMAGQSTFLTELSETASMLSSATRNSLVALDELGRGTSTSDGQAIAEAVLEHFVNKVQCRGMFSTHYHRLAVDYEKDPKVSLCHMSCKIGVGATGVEEVTFLYRLTPGACPKSYGVNVARLAGLPENVLQIAAAKSSEIESLYVKKGTAINENRGFNYAALSSILNTIKSKPSQGIGISHLIEHQRQARTLLLQN
ncbi:DNA mismatch repair protein MSH6 [Linum perenne]